MASKLKAIQPTEVKPAKPNLVYQEGAVTRTVEPFQKSRNKNEFGY